MIFIRDYREQNKQRVLFFSILYHVHQNLFFLMVTHTTQSEQFWRQIMNTHFFIFLFENNIYARPYIFFFVLLLLYFDYYQSRKYQTISNFFFYSVHTLSYIFVINTFIILSRIVGLCLFIFFYSLNMRTLKQKKRNLNQNSCE
jgi:hypothetical protein